MKATSHSEKKRRRRQRKAEEHALVRDPFALAEVPRRDEAGRAVLDRTPPDRQALVKRAALSGMPLTDGTIRDMRAPWWGCHVGQAIAAHTPHDNEREKLWAAICHIRRVVTAYDRAIGALDRHAQCLRLLVPVDEMHADAASPAHDDRTEEERYQHAVKSWVNMKAALTFVDVRAASEAISVVVDDHPPRDVPGLIAALLCVHEAMQGGRITIRDRSRK